MKDWGFSVFAALIFAWMIAGCGQKNQGSVDTGASQVSNQPVSNVKLCEKAKQALGVDPKGIPPFKLGVYYGYYCK